MGPLVVTAGIAAVLLAVVVGALVAVRRRERRRRAEAERRDDAVVRAQVLERLARVTAEWDGEAYRDETDVNGTGASAIGTNGAAVNGAAVNGTVVNGADVNGAEEDRDPVDSRTAAVTGLGHAVDEHPRHRRPGHGIRVRRHGRA